MNKLFGRGVVALLAACGFTVVQAQGDAARGYPAKPVHIIVGMAAGGGNDLFARIVAPKLSEGLGQPFVVENKAGASGIIAAEYVAKSPPDGYTLWFSSAGQTVINPIAFAKLPYSPSDLVPISLVATFPLVLAVNSGLPVKTVPELVAHMKAHPEQANASGPAMVFQLITELFKTRTGTPIEYVQYKAGNEAVSAVMSGDVQMTFVETGLVVGALRSGKVRGLAVTSPQRVSAFPNIPTMAEVGFPDMEMQLWYALFAPSKTPVAIVKRLESELRRIVALPDVRESILAKLSEPTSSTSEQLSRFISSEIGRWEAVRKAAGIKTMN